MVYYNPHITGTIPYMGVSKNNGTPKSSILIGFPLFSPSILGTPIFGNIHLELAQNMPLQETTYVSSIAMLEWIFSD